MFYTQLPKVVVIMCNRLECVFREKSSFFGNKTVDQRLGANLKNMFFAEICCKFLAFLSCFAEKTLKMTILTSVWNAQHPNTGQNIQHP